MASNIAATSPGRLFSSARGMPPPYGRMPSPGARKPLARPVVPATSNTSIRPLTRLASDSMRVTLYRIDAVESHSLPLSAMDPGTLARHQVRMGPVVRREAMRQAVPPASARARYDVDTLWHLGGQPAEQVGWRRGQSRRGRCHSWPRTCWARKAKTVSYQIWA